MQCKKTQHFNYLQIKLPQTVVVNVDKESDRNHVAEQHPVCCPLETDTMWKIVISSPWSQRLNLVQLTFSYDFPSTFSLLCL